MDPLSIVASSIALASFASVGLKRIRGLHGAGSEIDLLISEVADLELVLSEAQSCITQRESSSALDEELSEKIATLLLPAKVKLEELAKLISKLRTRGRDGKLKPAHLQWQRHKPQVKTMLSGLKEVRSNLLVLWGASQLRNISHIRLTLDNVSIVQASQNELLSNQTEILDFVSKQITQMTVTNTNISTDSNDSLQNEDDSTAERNESQLICANHSQYPVPRHQVAKIHSSDPCSAPTNYTSVRIRASQYRRTRCEGWCSCACHQPRGLKSPQLLESVFGSLFIGYSGFLSPRRACSELQCRQQSIPTIKLNYYFPSWMLARAFQVKFLMSYMGGPELILRCPRVIPDNSPVLFQAVQGNLAKIQYLFDKGLASPYDVALSNGRTALHYAVNGGHHELSQFLIDEGANPNAEDKNQLTTVSLAWERIFGMQTNTACEKWRSMFDSEEYLESQSFSPFHKIVLGLVSADLESQCKLSTAAINDKDLDGRTALSWAAGKGDLAAVKTLLHYDADPKAYSRRRQTALTWAMHNTTENRYPVASALLTAGCDVNWYDYNYRIPLIYAASMGDEPEILRLLVDAGADVNWRDCHKRTALGYAAKANLNRNMQFLLEHDADTSIADHWGYTPLIETVYQNHHDALQVLLKLDDVIPTHRAANGMSIAHVAALFADERTLDILSEADLALLHPDERNDDGLTALELFATRDDMNDSLRASFLHFLDVIAISEAKFQDASEDV